VEQRIQQLQRAFPGQVVATGALEDVEAVYEAMDIFCLPSWREGLPYTVIEAMLTGLPVVATDIRGCREQVLPEITGFLVPPGQSAPLAAAIERLLLDPEVRLRLGAMARQRALVLYDQTKVLQSQLDLFGQAIEALKSPKQALSR
jgi:glycosyltransferase involved in cell wall biosynthesis